MSPPHEVGRYAGEVLTLGDMLERYFGGGSAESPEGYLSANRQAAWAAERQARGVGVTAQYLFNAGRCNQLRKDLLVDAEDPAHANWTRFINHSARQPNLTVESEVVEGTPIVRFIVSRPIAPGDELLFDYGDGFELDVLDFED
eukprot:7381694-Prymnesium_polylepis.1